MTTVLSAVKPDVSVADAQAIIAEALAFIDEQRIGLVEISECIGEEGGAYGYILAQYVAPYVSKESCLVLFRPFTRQVWGDPAKVT